MVEVLWVLVMIVGPIAFGIWYYGISDRGAGVLQESRRARRAEAEEREAAGRSKVTDAGAHRWSGLNYLGGHPRSPQAQTNCTLIVTPSRVYIETATKNVVLEIELAQVRGISVATEAEATRRFTATRILTTGVFAFALPKTTPGSVLVLVDTSDGPIVFEKLRSTKTAMLAALGPGIALVPRIAAESQSEVPQAPLASPSLADELGKISSLHEAGLLSAEEFDRAKAKLLEDGPS